MPLPSILLIDLFPRAGFRWRRAQGDAAVRSAIADLLGGDSTRIRKPDAQKLVVKSLANATKMITDTESGIHAEEGIIDFLERSAESAELSKAIPKDTWVELVFQIAHARSEYKRHTTQAQQDSDRDRLTALSHAIDNLVRAAGNDWDWLALEFYAYPHLMGEAADYPIDEEE